MKNKSVIKISLIFSLLFLGFISFYGCSPSLEDTSFIYKKTSEHYDNALAANPDNLNLRIKLAEFYYRFNDYEKVKELLADMPQEKARIILAKTKAKLKDYTHALEVFNQVGDVDDSEYTYLYAYTCENKNLFPQAVELYKKVEGPFKELATARLKEIGIKIEQGIPSYINDLLDKQESFLSTLTEDEAVILLVDEDIEVTAQNTTTSSIHVIEKVLQERGKGIGEVKIGYDSTYERVELEFARTITPDGKVVYAGKDNLRDVSKYMNFPLYSNAHLFIISMPSVEVGSIIEYKVKLYSSKLIEDENFTFIYRLREPYPVAKASFNLTIPKKKDISLRFLNQEYSGDFNLKPKISKVNNKKTYLWQFSQIPAIVPEEKMPPYSEINPAIVMSSFSSWQQIYLWWHDLFKDKLTLSSDIKDFLNELIKDADSDLEKAKRIYEFCSRDIRYVGVEYGESGYEPHSAEEVYWNRYGDCKDKATLLVALMRQAGLDAYPVLIPTREVYSISKDQPSVNFNHAIAAINLNNELIFMDATSSTTSFEGLPLDDQMRKVLVFFPDKYEIIDTPLLKNSEVLYETNIKINEDEDVAAKRELIAKGTFASIQRYYFKNTHPQTIKEDIQERIARISPFSKLITYEVITRMILINSLF